MNTETMTPKSKTSLSGMRMNHISEDINSANSQIKAENMSRMIFIGSSVIVKKNIAKAGPKATRVLPMNSAAVMMNYSSL